MPTVILHMGSCSGSREQPKYWSALVGLLAGAVLAGVSVALHGCGEEGAEDGCSEGSVEVCDAARRIHSLLPAGRDDRANMMGLLVRLAFHDGASFDGITGGSDGCVDLASSENAGLAEGIELLAPIVSEVSPALSRADVWALAGNVMIQSAGGPKLRFLKGRVSNDTCDGQGSRHANAELDHTHIRSVFVDQLDFTERETVALIGAHVLGRAESSISGYSGAWVKDNDHFTNKYFKDLIDKRWVRLNPTQVAGSTRTTWQLTNGGMDFGDEIMLNTDIELAFSTTRFCGSAGGEACSEGDFFCCQRASHGFSAHVDDFARDQDVWFQVFAEAWIKMTSVGCGSLECALDDCSTPTF